jgi:hypothetical protein
MPTAMNWMFQLWSTKKAGISKYFERYQGATVALEAGTHSPWISRLLEQMGCSVYVGNPRKLRFIWDSIDKSDERDARLLARLHSFKAAQNHHGLRREK